MAESKIVPFPQEVPRASLRTRLIRMESLYWLLNALIYICADSEDMVRNAYLVPMPLGLLHPLFSNQYRQHLASINYDIITVAHRPAEDEAIDNIELAQLWREREQITLKPFHKTLMKAERMVMAKPYSTVVKVDNTGYVSHQVEGVWARAQIQKLLGSWGIVMGIHEIRAELNRIEYAYQQSEATGYPIVFEIGKILQVALQKAS